MNMREPFRPATSLAGRVGYLIARHTVSNIHCLKVKQVWSDIGYNV